MAFPAPAIEAGGRRVKEVGHRTSVALAFKGTVTAGPLGASSVRIAGSVADHLASGHVATIDVDNT